MTSGRALLACGILAACAALSARADPAEELGRLRDEAAQMRRSLDRLDAKIRALETEIGDSRGGAAGRAQEPTAAPPAAASAIRPEASPLLQLRRNWSQVEPGIPAERVEGLLGKPEKVLRIDGSLVWYYVYPGLGRGSVFFGAGGKVSSAQAPGVGGSF
jgi:hypothetical protein